MTSRRISKQALTLYVLGSMALAAICGCSQDAGNHDRSVGPWKGVSVETARDAAPLTQDGSTPPSNLVTVNDAGQSLELWPYTGESLDGLPSDPVNLLFTGRADPVRIRSALLQLDGNRTAFGFPDAYPFNARWSDAIGGVQTSYASGEGWQGSVIQLQLGVYAPIRVHLRLFRTGVSLAGGGTWTVGAAHFEVLIPGTADHQVLSWELAEQVVVADLVRSGLLDGASPLGATGAINAAPSFRMIPAVIYNSLPEELKAAIGGPAGSVQAPVPIASDGSATILHVKGEAAPVAGEVADAFTLTYNQIIPKPICSNGPLDWVLVSGPVELSRRTSVDASGRYQYQERVAGRLSITPIDITAQPPAPSGPSYEAEIGDLQSGAIDVTVGSVLAESRRIAPQPGGTEFVWSKLRVNSGGPDSYLAQSRCPNP
jgi:hypothetical protein